MDRERATRAIGVDLGGTTTRAALIDDRGSVIVVSRVFTKTLRSVAGLVDWVQAARHEWFCRAGVVVPKPLPVGIAVPGLLDDRRERVRRCVHVSWLEGQPLAHSAARAWDAPVRLVTDAEAATWGEHSARFAKPLSFAHLRLGTGIALGIVKNGALLDLHQDRSGHLDVLIVDRSDRALECPCGLRGCLETVASGAALTRRLLSTTPSTHLGELQQAFARGDATAVALLDETARWIVTAMRSITTQWQPEGIVLGGGVIAAIPSLFQQTAMRWREQPPLEHARRSNLELAVLNDDAGVIGAGLLSML